MKSHFKVSIPSKPYLIKYLQAQYGNPVVFNSNNFFGTSLIGFITTRIYLQNEKQSIRRQLEVFTESFVFYLPSYWLTSYQYKTNLPSGNVVYLNKHFEEKFDEDLTFFVSVFVANGMERKKAIEIFCNTYNIAIDQDLSFEALKKKEYRCRKKLLENLSKNVPPKPTHRKTAITLKNTIILQP